MIKRFYVFFLAACLLLTGFFVVPEMKVHAQTDPFEIFVNSPMDMDDPFLPDGICDVDPGQEVRCTLRAAISTANAYSGDSDLVYIHLPPGVYVLNLPAPATDSNAGGDLDFDNLEKAILLEGDPDFFPVIQANGLDRVITNYNSIIGLELRYLTLTGGLINNESSVRTGGGILNFGRLTLDSVVVENNQVICLPSASDCDPMIGGGIANYESLKIYNSTIRNNVASRGGGIFNIGGSDNLEISNTTIHGNHANTGAAITSYAPLQIVNSTISGNLGQAGVGGIDNHNMLTLANVTLAENLSMAGAVNLSNYHTVLMRNSIISSSQGRQNCACLNMVTSQGYNLSSDALPGLTPVLHDQVNVNPLLSSLGDHGDLMPGLLMLTHALTIGSPAVDAANPAGCLNIQGYALTYDQRGQPRPLHGCDIGAFELTKYGVYLPLIRR